MPLRNVSAWTELAIRERISTRACTAKDGVAIGWNQHMASGIVALRYCIRNCEDWEELQDKRQASIQRFVSTSATGFDLHPQRITTSNWWHTFQTDGSYPCLLSLLLLKLDVRLLGDVGICPGIMFTELPQTLEENRGHSRSYQFQENGFPDYHLAHVLR